MTAPLREYVGRLVVNRCWCGIQHAIPESLDHEQNRVHDEGGRQLEVFCPLGHKYVIRGVSKALRLERQLAVERARHDQTRADRDHEKRRRAAAQGAITKIKKRVGNGVCPCCKRTFKQLARHMKAKHPGYAPAADPAKEGGSPCA